jgi:hypothetical protein
MVQKFLSYITFWKKDESANSGNFNLKIMHGINKISIFMFLLAVIFLVIKYMIA